MSASASRSRCFPSGRYLSRFPVPRSRCSIRRATLPERSRAAPLRWTSAFLRHRRLRACHCLDPGDRQPGLVTRSLDTVRRGRRDLTDDHTRSLGCAVPGDRRLYLHRAGRRAGLCRSACRRRPREPRLVERPSGRQGDLRVRAGRHVRPSKPVTAMVGPRDEVGPGRESPGRERDRRASVLFRALHGKPLARSRTWLAVAAASVVVLSIVAFAARYGWPGARAAWHARRQARAASEHAARRALVRIARTGDASATYRALMVWRSRLPKGEGDDAPVRHLQTQMERSLFGGSGEPWTPEQGRTLAQVVRSIPGYHQPRTRETALPPLNPIERS